MNTREKRSSGRGADRSPRIMAHQADTTFRHAVNIWRGDGRQVIRFTLVLIETPEIPPAEVVYKNENDVGFVGSVDFSCTPNEEEG
jgi:hypothetical protein